LHGGTTALCSRCARIAPSTSHLRSPPTPAPIQRPHDVFGVSLCRSHHDEQHRIGAGGRPQPRLQPVTLQLFVRGGTGRQGGFTGGQESVEPAGKRRRRDAQRARDGFQVFPPPPPQSCAVATSCHRGRAPLRQTLAVAPQRSAALQQGSLDRPWHTSRAEIVRLRGVPINRGAGENRLPPRSILILD